MKMRGKVQLAVNFELSRTEVLHAVAYVCTKLANLADVLPIHFASAPPGNAQTS